MGARWGGGKETTALVLEDLSKGLNQVSAVAKGQAECRSHSEPAGLCQGRPCRAKGCGLVAPTVKKKKRCG